MIFRLFYFLSDKLTILLTHLVRSVLWCSFFISLAYSFGWVQRLLWLILEQTATMLWNGTPVTIGSLEIDFIRGRVWATNVVIHTPRRDEWQWESPLICRIGRLYVEHNWFSSFFTMLVRMVCGKGQKQVLELYTIEMSDIQGFIERKQHIFNFYLMDKYMDLPDPSKILEEEKEARAKHDLQQPEPQQSQQNQRQDACNSQEANAHNDTLSEASLDILNRDHQDPTSGEGAMHKRNRDSVTSISRNATDELSDGEDDAMVHRQAQQLVDEMFSAVKSFGRAARERGSLASALVEQRAQLTSKLKQFKGSKNKTEAMQEGVKVIKRVGKAVAKKTKDIKTAIPKMPPRREPDLAPVYARVGRVIIEDARIFTRTNNISSEGVSIGLSSEATVASTTETATSTTTSTTTFHKRPPLSDQALPHRDPDETGASTKKSQGLGALWNKPIGIGEIVLRSSELCPPSSLLDENGLPAIYQPIEKIADVVLKRALVGLANSNTSRFLQTALGELLEMEYSTIFGEHDISAGGLATGNPPSAPRPRNTSLYRKGSSAALSEPIL